MAEDTSQTARPTYRPATPPRSKTAPLPGNWPKLKQWLDRTYPEPLPESKTEWTWDYTDEGYKGVYISGNTLTWYDHSHNRFAGGWGEDQEIAAFLAHGPRLFPDDATIIHELYRAVKRRVASST